MRWIWLSLILPTQVFALSLQDCFQEALRKNETVPTQEENVYQAHETVKQAWGSLLPTISFDSQWQWQQQAPGSYAPLFPTYEPMAKLNASLPLIQGFREWNALDETKMLYAQQADTKQNVDISLYKTVVQGYYNILYYEKDISNLTEEVKYLNDRIAETQRFMRIGRAQLSDVLLAKTQLAMLQVTTEKDRYSLDGARTAFALLTGLDANVELDDDARSHSVPGVSSLDEYINRIDDRPDVKAAVDASDAAEKEINVAKADHLPSLAWNYDQYVARVGPQSAVAWDTMLTLTVPIFAGGVTQSKVRQAYSKSHQADLQLSLAKRTADQEIRSLYDSVVSDLKQIDLNRQDVKLSEAAFKEELRTYRLGLVTNLDVLTSLTNYIEAKRSFDQNRFTLKSDYLRLEAAAVLL